MRAVIFHHRVLWALGQSFSGLQIFRQRCYISQIPSHQTSGYPFVSAVMYAVHALIVFSRSRFTPLKLIGDGRSEMAGSRILLYRLSTNWETLLLSVWDERKRNDLVLYKYRSVSVNSSLSFRLDNGDDGDNSGVVEVYNGVSEWGHICGQGWNREITTADAICRHFGYPLALSTYQGSVDSQTRIFTRGFTCSEGDPIEHCYLTPWLNPSCPSIAGVVCFLGKF